MDLPDDVSLVVLDKIKRERPGIDVSFAPHRLPELSRADYFFSLARTVPWSLTLMSSVLSFSGKSTT
jgi:hypothetical protein